MCVLVHKPVLAFAGSCSKLATRKRTAHAWHELCGGCIIHGLKLLQMAGDLQCQVCIRYSTGYLLKDSQACQSCDIRFGVKDVIWFCLLQLVAHCQVMTAIISSDHEPSW